ncbi:MAG: uracil-DNA glycosylase family protein [Paludibacteraceae bacterium]|nr:uracil-DNA glycosylase family protein [Paludibacteraceae bacterium]
MPVTPETERHPLHPFLPENARLLMLGSFPPPRERWCMDFFYPNPQNDMWRIMGQVFFGDKTRFVERQDSAGGTPASQSNSGKTAFKYEEIVAFCRDKGIAIFDTAQAVRRLQGNAADEHLEIVKQTDIAALLRQLPLCRDICCTGGKAAETLAENIRRGLDAHTPVIPKTGGYVETVFAGRTVRFWRMPSSSRAYPLSLDRKAAAYRQMFEEIGLTACRLAR